MQRTHRVRVGHTVPCRKHFSAVMFCKFVKGCATCEDSTITVPLRGCVSDVWCGCSDESSGSAATVHDSARHVPLCAGKIRCCNVL